MDYEIIKDLYGNDVITLKNEDGSTSFIPKDERNSDYQRYLRWLKNPNAENEGGLATND